MSQEKDLYSIPLETVRGQPATLGAYRGQVLLIVNVASKCGFTPQYEGLEKLYQKHSRSGLVVLGFPCNQFGAQEPGTEEEIQSFCSTQYGVSFPLFKKIEVNGKNAHPLYRLLKQRSPGILGTQDIKWNFTKFLVARDGSEIKRFAPTDPPEKIEPEILKFLG